MDEPQRGCSRRKRAVRSPLSARLDQSVAALALVVVVGGCGGLEVKEGLSEGEGRMAGLTCP